MSSAAAPGSASGVTHTSALTGLADKQFAMGAPSKGAPLQLIEFTPPALGDKDVFIDVKYCGMCHSDVHKIDDDWHNASGTWPMVPGHEVVGVVAAVGAGVTSLKVGDLAGCGPQRGSCGCCEYCDEGIENVCSSMEGLYDPKFGGYATSITVHERFTFPVPSSIPLQVVGPLLCAGVTTYAPLARHVKRGDRVGIVGIGGLGHMALQYAAALGCETWAISSSAAKEAEARKFGASHFLNSSDADAMSSMSNKFDFVLCTASGKFDVDGYLRLLKPRRSFCLVGLPAVETPLEFKPFSIVGGEKQIIGSMIGGSKAMKEMLAFSAEHKCYPQVEVISLEEANEGFRRIRENTPRYRVVLKIDGFRDARK